MSTAANEAPVVSIAELQPQLHRKIELCPQRIHFNGITASLGEFAIETLNPSVSEKNNACSLKVEASTQARRSVAGEFYEHGFDPELSFRIRFQKIGAGLENLGNTCYLNSVLQCLTYTEPFAAYLQSENHKSLCRNAGFCAMCALQNHVTVARQSTRKILRPFHLVINLSCRNAGFCAMCALQNHVMVARQSTGKILRPFHLVKNLRCISRNFRYSRQEDAHEYMVNLLESIHKCCLPYGVQSESRSAYEKSQVYKIFGGQLRSQVKCEQCSHCSDRFDPFLDLSLEISKADSLQKALAHFTARELLDDGERHYQCQHCKEKVRAFKQLTIHKAPHVLTIHLKRFGSTIHGEKLSKKVEYGPTLDLNPFISDSQEGGYNYTLYGVLVHAGWTTHSGHYFCYVRTSAGTWYSLDDNQVTQVSEKTVLSREAYMLFYVSNRTFAVKRSVSSARKPDILTNAAGNKVIHMMERQPSSVVYTSVKTNNVGTHSEFVPLMETSLQQSVKNEGLLLHHKDQVEIKYSCMPVDDDVFEAQPSSAVYTSAKTNNDGTRSEFVPAIETSLQQSVKKEGLPLHHKGQVETKHSCMPVDGDAFEIQPSSAVYTSVKIKNDGACSEYVPAMETPFQQSVKKEELLLHHKNQVETKGSFMPDDGDAFTHKQETSSSKNPAKLLPSFDSKLPFDSDKKNNTTNESSPDSALAHKLMTDHPPCQNDIEKVIEPNAMMNDSIQKESVGTRMVDNQNNCQEDHDFQSCSINPQLQNGGGNSLKLIKVDSLLPSTTVCCAQQDTLADVIPKKLLYSCHLTESKLKKLRKISSAKGLYFGRKQLFFMSLYCPKKKRMRCKKHHLTSRNKLYRGIVGPSADLHEASTSESFQTIDVVSRHPPRKHSHSTTSRKSKGNESVKIGSSSFNNKGFTTSMSSVMLETSNKSSRFCSTEEEILVKGPEDADIHNFSANLLMKSMKETSVTRWVDNNFHADQMNAEKNLKRTVDCILDEWDQDYDKGKRKKVKKSSYLGFGVHNPFQELASLNANRKKSRVTGERKSSGDQPFRI